MKNIIFLALVVLLGLSACAQAGQGMPPEPVAQPGNAETNANANANANANTETQPQSTSGSTVSQAPDASAVMEETSGPLTARIFSTPETTINQVDYSLQGWVNRAAVISVNDTIVIAKAEETFTAGLTLEPGPNLVEVIISDQEGNEVEFDLTVFVES